MFLFQKKDNTRRTILHIFVDEKKKKRRKKIAQHNKKRKKTRLHIFVFKLSLPKKEKTKKRIFCIREKGNGTLQEKQKKI